MSVAKYMKQVSINLTSNKMLLVTISVILLSLVFASDNYIEGNEQTGDQNDLSKLTIEKVDVDLKQQKCFGFYRRYFPRPRPYGTTRIPGTASPSARLAVVRRRRRRMRQMRNRSQIKRGNQNQNRIRNNSNTKKATNSANNKNSKNNKKNNVNSQQKTNS